MSEFARASDESAAAWRDRVGRVDPSALTAAQYQDWGVQRILARGAAGDEARAAGERASSRAAADRAADRLHVDSDVLRAFKAAVPPWSRATRPLCCAGCRTACRNDRAAGSATPQERSRTWRAAVRALAGASDASGKMQPVIVMACVACMVVGAAVAVVGRVLRRIERGRLYSGEDPPRWGGWVMLAGAALFVPAAVLLVVIVKYF